MRNQIETQDMRESFSALDEWEEEMETNRFCRYTGRILGDLETVQTDREFNEPVKMADFDAMEALQENRFYGSGRMLLTSDIWDREEN